jgi:hypothetical protein
MGVLGFEPAAALGERVVAVLALVGAVELVAEIGRLRMRWRTWR